MFDPSPIHLLILGVIVLLVMGPKRLPELARSLGHGISEFRGSLGGAVPEPRPNAPGELGGAAVGEPTAGAREMPTSTTADAERAADVETGRLHRPAA